MRRTARSAGFTMVELVVSVGLLGLVLFYLMGTFTVNQKTYMALDQVTEAQQNSRAVADLMEKDMRHAGFLVPPGAAVCGVDSTTAPDIMYVSDADPLLTANALAGDMGAALTGSLTVVTIGSVTTISVDDVVLDGSAFYDTNNDGTLDSDFQTSGGIIITDTLNPGRGSLCGTVVNVNPLANSIQFIPESGSLAAATPPYALMAVPAHEYRVNLANTELRRNGMLLARGVEDLQFAVWFDLNDNNMVDPNEYRGDGTDPDYVPSTLDHSDGREMRVNLVMRTRDADPNFRNGQEQRTENRTVAGGNDGFRRRVHTSRARLRNVANRI